MIFKYARVSTKEQNEALQLTAMNNYEHDEIFIDKQSGRSTDRPELNRLRAKLRKGDTVIAYDISRLARNVKHLLILIDELNDLGVNLVVVKEQIDTTTAMGRLMITLLGAVAEMESSNISRKVKAGMKESKKKAGKPPIKKPKNFEKIIALVNKGELSNVDAMKFLNLKKTSYYKLLKQ